MIVFLISRVGQHAQHLRLLKNNYSNMVKVLNVAEKNDAAKSIAELMSAGRYKRREGFSKYNKIYEFDYNLMNQNVCMVMTSVSGHLLNNDFSGQYKHWSGCRPLALFDAPVEKFCPQNFVDIKRTLEREARGCDSLVIWTDGDREGENIGYEIIDVCKAVKRSLKVYRARFSEITRAAIGRAVNNLGPPDKRVSDAVDVRMELDLRIGAAFTRFQTLHLKRAFPQVLADQLISYGSCQFPTLGFVVERYKQVQAFIPEPFWKIKVTLDTEEGICEFSWKRHRLFDHLACLVLYEHIIENPVAKVLSVSSKPKSKWRPVALDTVELEKLASRKLRINAKETMKIAEKLYTQGFISYPRTETNIFPKELDLANLVQQQTADNRWGGFASNVLQQGPRPRNGNKSDKAHPPIHPTKYTNGLQGNEARLYEFVVRHFLACVSEDAKGQETTVEIEVNEELFTASGLMILARNYLDVYPYDKWNAKVIPTFEQGSEFEPSSVEMSQSETSPPSLLTEADLIALMDKHGIGTDATHAEHIETIKARLYVGVREDGKFVPGELGMGLVEGYDLMGYEISKPNLRAELEADLKRICEGTKDKNVVLREQVSKYREVFMEACQQAKKIDEALSQYFGDSVDVGDAVHLDIQVAQPVMSCQKCKSDMIIKKKKDGKGFYLSCMGFPQCKNAVWFPDAVLQAEVSDSSCSNCGQGAVKKVKFKFKKGGVPPYIPLEYEGCVICDTNLKDIINSPALSTNSTDRTNHRSQSTSSGGLNVPRQNNNTNTGQRSYSTSSVSRNTGTHQGMSNIQSHTMSFQDSGYSSSGASGNESTNTQYSNQTWRTGSNTKQNYSRNSNTNSDRENMGSSRTGAGFLSPLRGSSGRSALSNADSANNSGRNTMGAASDENSVVCNCNDDAKMFTVKKSGPNCGRPFYTCAKPQDSKCGFFLWADQAPDNGGGDTGGRGQNRRFGSTGISTGGYGGAGGGYRGGGDSDTFICNCRQEAKLQTVQKEGSNKGRQFYSCPKPPRESRCNYFQWADQPAQDNNRSNSDTGGYNRPQGGSSWSQGGHDRSGSFGNSTGNSDVMCNCNLAAKQLTVHKEGPNKGRPFYGCTKPREQGCGFFQWADEDSSNQRGGSGGQSDFGQRRKPSVVSDAGGNQPKKKRKCGVCGMEGHNRKNCPQNR